MESGRIVVDNLLRGKKAERVAVMDSPWTGSILRWVAEGHPTRTVYKEVGKKRWRSEDGRWEDVTVAGEYVEPMPAWEHFGYDMVGVGGHADALERPEIHPDLHRPAPGHALLADAVHQAADESGVARRSAAHTHPAHRTSHQTVVAGRRGSNTIRSQGIVPCRVSMNGWPSRTPTVP